MATTQELLAQIQAKLAEVKQAAAKATPTQQAAAAKSIGQMTQSLNQTATTTPAAKTTTTTTTPAATPTQYKHPTTGAVGAKTPQGDIVYGPLAQQYLTPSPKDPIPTSTPVGERELENLTPIPESLTDAIRDIMSGTAESDRYYQALVSQIEQQRLQMQKMETERAGALDKVKNFFSSQPTYKEMETQARQQFLERFGLPADWEQKQMNEFLQMQTEIGVVRNNINALEIKEQEALMMSEQRMGPMTFIRGEQALIQRQYAVQRAGLAMELSSKAAVAEMYRGNTEMADRYMKDYVTAATYNLQQKKEEIMWFMDYYSNEFNALDSKVQNSIQQTLQFVQQQEAIKREELTNKMNIVMQAAEAGVNLNLSGKEIASMDLPELVGLYTQKIGQMPATLEAPKVFGGETGGYTEQFYNPATNQWEYRKVVGGIGWKPDSSSTITDFTATQKKQLQAKGINWTTTEGYQKAIAYLFGGQESVDNWDKASNYIMKNVEAGATGTQDMTKIYATLLSPSGANLNATEARALMAQYGMIYDSMLGWQYESFNK
jgi:hypothetical protein